MKKKFTTFNTLMIVYEFAIIIIQIKQGFIQSYYVNTCVCKNVSIGLLLTNYK